jgi:hypothetical protein
VVLLLQCLWSTSLDAHCPPKTKSTCIAPPETERESVSRSVRIGTLSSSELTFARKNSLSDKDRAGNRSFERDSDSATSTHIHFPFFSTSSAGRLQPFVSLVWPVAAAAEGAAFHEHERAHSVSREQREASHSVWVANLWHSSFSP